jgi:LPXTG-site transpeptidase (sortase) family protein
VALIARAFGTSLPSRLGSLLTLVGLGLVLYSVGAYFGLLPGGYTTVPEPVALSAGQRAAHLEADVSSEAAAAPAAPAPAGPAVSVAVPDPAVPPPVASRTSPMPAVAVKLDAADAADRREAALAPRAGTPVRLVLPSINVDTEVKPGGLVPDKDGELEWETLPFVATVYPMLGPVGAPGNAVISGHVVTLSWGNVFRDLYQVTLGEPIEVYTDDSHFTYKVEEIKLVKPDDVEVMAPTEDSRLTVITCGGTFDPRTRTFSDRLVVVGKLVGGERLRASG